MSGVRCGECGAMNEEGDDFCGQCGSYLAWDRTTTTDAASGTIESDAATPADATVVSDLHPGRVAGLSPDEPSFPAEPDGADPPPATPIPTLTPTPTPTPTAPSPLEPAARKPTVVPQRAPKPAPRTTQETVKSGDIICARCGTGNSPDRHFCRHCAAPLGATANRTQPRSQQAAAGTRPKSKRRRIRAAYFVVPAVIIAAAATIWFAREGIGSFVATVADRVVDSSARNPVELIASSAADGRGPELAHDGFADRSWAPAPMGPANGEFLEARFAAPFRLVAVQVSPGASAEQAAFLAEGRPATMRVIATDAAGASHEVMLTLADEPGPQRFDVGIDDVTAVRLVLETAHGATDATRVALAEVEFLGR